MKQNILKRIIKAIFRIPLYFLVVPIVFLLWVVLDEEDDGFINWTGVRNFISGK